MKLKTLLRYAKLSYLRQSRTGWCPVCSRRTVFVVVDPETIRENALCFWCRSSSRNRHVARCILQALAARGVKRFGDLSRAEHISVYNLSASGPFARVWGRPANITYSEYFDGCRSGERRDGILCQDVQRLSFDDESFDLVVSEDVFEHVPDYRRGFAEVRRVLKPGGYHIFSVPFSLTGPTTERFELRDGAPVPVLPVESHGDPVRGTVPVFTDFGSDLPEVLTGVGFEVRLEWSQPQEEKRYGTFASYTFVTRKM